MHAFLLENILWWVKPNLILKIMNNRAIRDECLRPGNGGGTLTLKNFEKSIKLKYNTLKL
jgi:2-phospho-L-lactate guanylyltransferase (CobY/MobA/RfbA family)